MCLIQARNLVKKFRKTTALDDISFDIEEGEVLGILGPNGAGKSSTIYLLSTLMKPDSGEILFKNQSIIKKPGLIRPILGLVPQDIALYPGLSARDNLKFWGRIYGVRNPLLKSKINEAVEIVGLQQELDRKVETYSGGMKRRLNIAAALIHNPKLIIMDEPTVGIDTQSRRLIISAIRELNSQGATIVYTSHYLEEIEALCHKVVILERGKVVASGDREHLMKLSGVKEEVSIRLNNKEERPTQLVTEITAAFPEAEVVEADGTIDIMIEQLSIKLSKILNIFDNNNAKIDEVNINKPSLEKIYFNLIRDK